MHIGSGHLRKSADGTSCGGSPTDPSLSTSVTGGGGGGFSVILSRGGTGGALSTDGSLHRYASHPRLVSISNHNQQPQQTRPDEGIFDGCTNVKTKWEFWQIDGMFLICIHERLSNLLSECDVQQKGSFGLNFLPMKRLSPAN